MIRTTYPRGPLGPQSAFERLHRAFNRISPNVIVFGILGLNLGVFVLWSTAKAAASEGDRSLLQWMSENFLLHPTNLRQGRFWVLLTSSFSHEGVGHILINAFTFFFLGPPTIGILGNSAFLALYLGGGLFSASASAIWHRMKGHWNYASHGASGAIYSVMSFFAFVAPNATFLLFGIVPVPAWAMVAGVFAYDTYGAYTEKKSGTDEAAHIGGLVAGALYYFARSRGLPPL
ncbi:rhomboid-domain-containing protein [Sistotremastrum suecicum HHB10207 ss-3]|uniref:Rhomboid-domain-containing protein n=1 Tax=Sistotremastrum suecicum HHB10207 ss-3 TaxID=1314776 RepID=A0A165YY39_9AGAM|nr:rhomboid-domain-containing protein [Sistotremastrum suecicum HHB10207 ss-3]